MILRRDEQLGWASAGRMHRTSVLSLGRHAGDRSHEWSASAALKCGGSATWGEPEKRVPTLQQRVGVELGGDLLVVLGRRRSQGANRSRGVPGPGWGRRAARGERVHGGDGLVQHYEIRWRGVPRSRAWVAVGGRARRVAAGAASTPSGPVGGLYIQPPQREAASHALERRAAVSSAVSVRLRFRGCRSDVQTLGLPGFAVPRGGGGVTCWLLDDTWLCLGSRVS